MTARTLLLTTALPERLAGLSRRQLIVPLYLVACAAGIVARFLLAGPASSLAYVFVSALPVAALVVGPLIWRPRRVLPWWLLAVGQTLFLAADLTWFSADVAGTAAFPSLADVFYLLGYPALIGGVALFIHSRHARYRLAPLIDALALGIAATLAVWLAGIETFAYDTGIALADRLVMIAYPVSDTLLGAGAAYLLLVTGPRQGNSRRLLLGAFVLLLAADASYSLMLTTADGYAHGFVDGLWLGSYMLFGLAALVPSMTALTEPDPATEPAGHLLPMVVATGVVPLFAVGQQLLYHHIDLQVVVVSEAVLGFLLLLRVYELHRVGRIHLGRLRQQANILANVREAVVATDLDGTITHWNAGAARLFGYDADIIVGRPLAELYSDIDPARVRQWLARVIAGSDYEGDFEGRRRDGGRVVVEVHAAPMVGSLGEVEGVLAIAADVTDRRRADRTSARLAKAIEQTSEAVVITNAAAEIEFVNPAFERITGYSAAEVLGKNPRLLKSGHQGTSYYEAMWSTLLRGQPWRSEFRNRRKDGSFYDATAVVSPIRGSDGQTTGYVSVSRDVTAERLSEQRSQQLARERLLVAQTLRDLDPQAPAEANSAAICRQLLSLSGSVTSGLFIFTPDGRAAPYGFAVAGDGEPLHKVPKRRTAYLKARAASGPWIAAWRDLPGHPYNRLFLELGVQAIAYAPVRSGDALIGFLHLSSAEPNAQEVLGDLLPALIEFADICGALLTNDIRQRHALLVAGGRVRQTIRQRAFGMAVQPIHELASGEVVGYEALARFTDGTPPDRVLADAAAVGMEVQLDLALIRAALETTARLPARRFINLNVCPATVLQGRSLAGLLRGIEREIVLEITEHSQITDYDAFRRAIGRLGPHVRLAVDDTGSGYASLRHILELRPDVVKLDRNLVQGVDSDEARRALIAGIRHFTQLAGCDLIAEGVETQAELDALRSMGVSFAQGYLLGRPLGIEALLAQAAA